MERKLAGLASGRLTKVNAGVLCPRGFFSWHIWKLSAWSHKRTASDVKSELIIIIIFSSHLPCCSRIFLRTYSVPSVLTLCALIFLRTYPAVRLFFCTLTLLCPFFIFTYPAVPLFIGH